MKRLVLLSLLLMSLSCLHKKPDLTPVAQCAKNEVFVQFREEDELQPLCVGKTEVMVEEYAACVEAGACDDEKLDCAPSANWQRKGREKHPVNCVNAKQAEAYCAWKQARLPSWDEWTLIAADEARSGKFPWGTDDTDDRLCWSGKAPRTSTCISGAYPEGAPHHGVRDLAGNVWEWTSTEKSGFRWLGGGAWNDSDEKKFHSSYYNNKNGPKDHWPDVGFRCVKPAQ